MIYVVVTIILIFASLLDYIEIPKKLRITLIYLLNALLIFMSGLRYETGHDYYNYINIFDNLSGFKDYFTSYQSSPVEVGYALLNITIKKLGGGPEVLYFVIAFLTIVIFSYAINKQTKHYFTTMLMFYFLLYYENTMGHIRAGMAMAIILFSLKYIEKQDFIKFLVLIIAAATFHSTALVVLPVYFIKKYDPSKKVITVTILAAFLIGRINIIEILVKYIQLINFNFYLTNKIINYASNEVLTGTFKTILMRLGILIAFILSEKNIRDKLKNYKAIMYMQYLGTIMLLMLSGSPSDFGTRGTRSLFFIQILILPSLLENVKNIYLRMMAHFVIVLYGLFLFLSYMSVYGYAFFPYKNIFLK